MHKCFPLSLAGVTLHPLCHISASLRILGVVAGYVLPGWTRQGNYQGPGASSGGSPWLHNRFQILSAMSITLQQCSKEEDYDLGRFDLELSPPSEIEAHRVC